MHTIRTNGTLLDDAWAAFFAEHGFLVGLSIDGPPEVHDTYRVDKGGKGSFARVMRRLATLQRNGVEWNALITVHAANQDRGREIYLFLRDQCGARFMTMIDLITSPQQAKFGLAKRDALPGSAAGATCASPATADARRTGSVPFRATVKALAIPKDIRS